ncbi:hypothetical protein HDU98_002337, partial [Podochytrium sp. JEL0797]
QHIMVQQILRRMFVSTAGTCGLATGAYFIYTRPVRTVTHLTETPPAFQAAVEDLRISTHLGLFNHQPTWGFYTRSRRGEPLGDAASVAEKQAALESFSRNVFSSVWYKLEVLLSGAKEVASAVESKEGEYFGNLKCIERHANESLWLYDHPLFNFVMFFGSYRDTLGIGFIEVNGDAFEDLGSRVLLPLLLEDGVRKR